MSWLAKLTSTSPRGVDAGLLVLRLWFGLVMAFGHGLGKVTGLGGFIDKVGQMGFPVPVVSGTFAAFAELLGGLLIALGLMSRVAGVTVFLTMLGAAFVVHANDPFMKKEFALAYAVAALVVVVAGPGKFSVDAKIYSRSSASE